MSKEKIKDGEVTDFTCGISKLGRKFCNAEGKENMNIVEGEEIGRGEENF